MKILLVDDDFVDREQVKRILRNEDQNIHIVEAESVDDGLTKFEQETFDMVLLDYRMPQKDGIVMLRALRAMPMTQNVAVIFLSHSEDIQLSIECIQQGAQDYVVKSKLTAAILKRAILHAQTRFKLEQKLHKDVSKTKELAEHDSLTGLTNRYAFERDFKTIQTRAKRQKSSLALLLFDLDRFKHINDQYGHNMGDVVLKTIAGRVSRIIRSDEIFARLGGDEFVILLSGQNCEMDSSVIAKRVLETICQPITRNNITILTGASIGIALEGSPEQSLESLLSNADIALYRAKSEGRGEVRFFEQQMQQEFERRTVMEERLKKALANQQLDLFYQPIMNIQTQTVVGYESTLRLHQENDIIEAKEFIAYAEESTMIWDIGRWAIETSIATFPVLQSRHLKDSSQGLEYIAINLSSQQLDDPNLPAFIYTCLFTYEVDAKNIIFEISETTVERLQEQRLACLQALVALNCRIALEAFGSGKTAVSHLWNYPIDVVKLAPEVLHSDDPKLNDVFDSLYHMLIGLKKEVIIKGVETLQQHNVVKALNATHCQGDYYGKPTPQILLTNQQE